MMQTGHRNDERSCVRRISLNRALASVSDSRKAADLRIWPGADSVEINFGCIAEVVERTIQDDSRDVIAKCRRRCGDGRAKADAEENQLSRVVRSARPQFADHLADIVPFPKSGSAERAFAFAIGGQVDARMLNPSSCQTGAQAIEPTFASPWP